MDEGMTWPEKGHFLVNADPGFGYSCLAMVDELTLGILYEGVSELYLEELLEGYTF